MATKEKKATGSAEKLYKKISKTDAMFMVMCNPYKCTYRQGEGGLQDYDGCDNNLMMIIEAKESIVKELDVDHPQYDKDHRTIMVTIQMYNGLTDIFIAFEKG